MNWRKAVETLLAAALPKCAYHPNRIATHQQWVFAYCPECAAKKQRDDTLPIIAFHYADAVMALDTDEEDSAD